MGVDRGMGHLDKAMAAVALSTVLSNHQPEAHSSPFLMWRRAEPGQHIIHHNTKLVFQN